MHRNLEKGTSVSFEKEGGSLAIKKRSPVDEAWESRLCFNRARRRGETAKGWSCPTTVGCVGRGASGTESPKGGNIGLGNPGRLDEFATRFKGKSSDVK